ncbi:MAG TPA: HD domain-containing phosphohydrolase [Gemmatimonadaceae bacterium]|nr:HD domain-containing phosphohydrolase [Gemmatimonadaceae bacterium]
MTGGGTVTESVREGDRQLGANVRRGGRTFMIAFYAALRAIKLYPLEHSAVQKTLAELAQVAEELRAEEGELEFRVSGEFIFINSTRLRLDLSNYATFGHILTLCKLSGIGAIHVGTRGSARDWTFLLSLLGGETQSAPTDRHKEIVSRLGEAKIETFQLDAPTETQTDREFNEEAKAAANRTYSQSVAVTKDVINSVRIGKTPNIRKIKRVVQGIVDQVLNEETSLIGLTAIRDYDEYTFTHSVNVCIFSIALGRRLGMTKLQLYELGLAALMHDIGKSRVPLDLLQKTGELTDEEWKWMAAHPWLGVLVLFQFRRQQEELSYRAMTVCHEHHMKIDLTGYPKVIRPRQMSLLSKIVSIADGYDAATSRRVYKTVALAPSAVLEEMRDNPRRGLDQVLVKAFINLLGIYPVGTLVVLDTFELAVVSASNQNPEALSRPIIKIISDAQGNRISPPLVVDLAIPEAGGQYARTIIKTADPDRYGITPGDYLI